MGIYFKHRVAIVTGAGGGLGRKHALALAARGAKVVVNDFGRPAHEGASQPHSAAEAVVREIRAAGGTAMAHPASVTDEAAVADMVAQALLAGAVWTSWSTMRASCATRALPR